MRILLLNQCFYPDVVSTAQHLTDLAVKLAGDGHEVTVIASRRGYDNPAQRFPKRETWKQVNIIRIPSTGLGKKAKWRRAVDFGSFMLSCAFCLLRLRKFDVVVALTSPPLISFLGALVTRIKGGRFVFWVMDLNPDEAIAAGWLREQSLAAKSLQAILRFSLRQSDRIIALDRFMKDRLAAKGELDAKISVIPPWSHDDAIGFDREGRAAFRERHELSNKFIVMYSGNHSPCHPLDTLLGAAHRLRDHAEIAFCFVGGGSEFNKVKAFAREHDLQNVLCLPYQPMSELAASLSAADLHAVVMGEPFVGIVHPCKIYNIMKIGAPLLYIGPAESHVADILSASESNGLAHTARHGDADRVSQHILQAAQDACRNASERTSPPLAAAFSKERLLPQMIEMLEPTADTSPITAIAHSS